MDASNEWSSTSLEHEQAASGASVENAGIVSLPRPLSSPLFASLLLVGLFFLLTLPPSLLRPFHSKGEPREALVALSMVSTGDWILPKRYQGLIATKPPMTHWMMAAASYLEGGLNEFSSRAPSLLLSFLSLVLLFTFLAKRTSVPHAFLSSLMLLASGLWYRSSITSRVDMPLAGFLTAAFLFLFVYEEREFKSRRYLFGAIAALTCGMLTKGPVALVIPAMVWTLYLLLRKHSLKAIFLTGFKIFLPPLLISSVWYMLAYLEGGQQFLDVVLLENFSRMTGTMNSGKDPHQHSIVFLVGTLIAGTLPWSFGLFLLPWWNMTFLRKAITFTQPRKVISSISPVTLYFSLITAAVFIFFCIPSSKKAEYLLPLYPFLMSLLASAVLHSGVELKQATRRWSISLLCLVTFLWVVVSLALVLAPILLPVLPIPKKLFFEASLPELLSQTRWLIPLMVIGACYFGYRCFQSFSSGGKVAGARLAITSYLFTVTVVGALLVPPIATKLSAKPFADEVSQKLSSSIPLYSQENFYGLDFYLGKRIKEFKPTEDLSIPAYVFVSDKRLAEFQESLPDDLKAQVVMTARNDIRKPGGLVDLVEILK